MIETKLGKITEAEFGYIFDMPFLFGLKLTFGGEGWGIGDDGRYTMNLSKECKWDTLEEKNQRALSILESVNSFLKVAKVQDVSELRGKPVEVIIENTIFKNFRILTEVL